MRTLTATEARKNLTHWLKAAKNGEEIGIIYGADVFAIRPVPIHAADYPQAEYGVSAEQMKAFEARITAEIGREKALLRRFMGKMPKARPPGKRPGP